jgi:hypothetical protein
MGFQGLVMTDALNMKGVTKFYKPGEVDVEALIAGNDLLMYSEDVGAVLDQVQKAIAEKRLSQQEIDDKCRKLLHTKYGLGLNNQPEVPLENLIDDLNTPYAELLHRELVEASMTMVKNQGIVPLKRLDTLSIASVSIGSDHITPFQKMLENYTGVDHFLVPIGATSEQTSQFRNQLKEYDLLIVGLHGVLRRPGNQKGYSDATYQLLDELLENQNTIMVSFRNPYTLDLLPTGQALAVLCAYQDQLLGQQTAAQVLFGAVGASGKLPVSVNTQLPVNTGADTPGGQRFKYTQPEEVGMQSKLLAQKVDSIVNIGLDSAAYPGAQVLLAKDG